MFRDKDVKMVYKEVSHVIFDLDGLLLDSEQGYDRIISEIAQQYGKRYTVEARMKILGTPEPETMRLAVELLNLPITVDEFGIMYRKKILSELNDCPLFPGAERLIHHLKKHGIPHALATSGSKEVTDVKLKRYEALFSSFKHIVCGSDPEVRNGKPSPDIFLVCASRFDDKPKPEMCLVFEDAPNGVKGARAANMQVVMVPGKDCSEELRKDATIVLESLEDFKPELFGLPSIDN